MAEGSNGKKIALNGGFLMIVAVGINLLIVLVNLIVSSGYTSKADFTAHKDAFEQYKEKNEAALSAMREKETAQLGTIANGITELNGRMQDNIRQDSALKDHEERIRNLEHPRR